MLISGYMSMIDKGKTVVVNKFIINTDRQDPRSVLMHI